MEDEEGRKLTTLGDARTKHHGRVRVSKQGRTTAVNEEDLFLRIESRIAKLFASRRVRIEGRHEVGDAKTLGELKKLRDQRRALMIRLGPARVPLGVTHEIHHNGVSFRFAPFLEARELVQRLLRWAGPTIHGPTARRDRLLWMIWHFRRRAVIQRARLPTKVRGGLSVCAQCGHKHRTLSRIDSDGRSRGCPRCGDRTHKRIQPKIEFLPFGRITQVELRRRFKVSERQLQRILHATPPELLKD